MIQISRQYDELVARAKELFPSWSTQMRTKWVIARMRCGTARVQIGCLTGIDMALYVTPRVRPWQRGLIR